MADDIATLRGTLPRTTPRPGRAHARGRVCEAEGCVTLLSIYNEGGRCWLHEPVRFPRLRGRRRRPAG